MLDNGSNTQPKARMNSLCCVASVVYEHLWTEPIVRARLALGTVVSR